MGYPGDDRYGGDRGRERGENRSESGGNWRGERDQRHYGTRDWGREGGSWNEGRRESSGGTGGYGASSGRESADRNWDRGGNRDYRGGDDDRGFFDRAGDEVRSWFGDEEAQRRREADERRWEQERGMTGGRDNDYGRSDYGRSDHARDQSHGGPGTLGGGGFGGGWGNQAGESWNQERPGRPGWFSDSAGGERGHRQGGSGGRGRFGAGDDADRYARGGGERYARSGGGASAGGERYERGGGQSGPSGAGYASGAGGDRPGIGGGGFDAPGEYGRRFDRVDAGSTGTHGAHPMSAPVGGGFGSTMSTGREAEILRQAGAYGGREQGHGGQGRDNPPSIHDPHYSEWRRRQIEDLDRDYDEYRREHQSKFEQEFGGWRSKRQGQRQLLNRVDEHMEVVGSDGSHVGKVDKVAGDRIILAKNDPSAGGMHHSIPCGWVETVDQKVTLNRTAEQAKLEWRNEERNRALFERPDSGSDGPHVLNRSFAGTYDDDDRDTRRGVLSGRGESDRSETVGSGSATGTTGTTGTSGSSSSSGTTGVTGTTGRTDTPDRKG